MGRKRAQASGREGGGGRERGLEETAMMRTLRVLRTLAAILLAGSCGGEAMVRPPAAIALVTPAKKEVATKRRSTEPLALRVTLDDPRFGAVNERLRARDAAGAARAFEDA